MINIHHSIRERYPGASFKRVQLDYQDGDIYFVMPQVGKTCYAVSNAYTVLSGFDTLFGENGLINFVKKYVREDKIQT